MPSSATPRLREVLADLPYLVAVADAGGVSAAADELGVPQSTVSRGLARLADRLGAPVLARRGRGVELSAEAVEFLPHARRALDEVLTGTGAAQQRAAERDNTATVHFQHTLGRAVVPALLQAVLAERPGSRFALHQGAREMCVEALESGRTDVALLSPPHEGGGDIRTVRLYAEPLVLAVAPQHPFAERRQVRLRELEGQVLLQMGPTFGLRAHVDHILDDAGVTPERGFEGEDVQTLRGLVSVGLGVAILPPARIAAPDIVEVPIADKIATREIGISWRADRDASAAAHAVFALAARPEAWLPAR
jgi:DNA-binding transcriptional LysR family regulator